MKNLVNFKKSLKISLLGMFITTNVAAAQEKHLMHHLVKEVAENYVYQNAEFDDFSEVNIAIKSIDERILIPACPVDLVAGASKESLKQSNVTVKVTCPSNNWFHYLNARITELQDVVVVDDTVSPDTLLTRNNVKVIKMDKKRLRGGTFADIESVLGARLKRRTRDGSPITSRMLCFVCKGDPVVITAKLSGLEIKTAGIAQQDGNVGDTIVVKNRKSKKLIDAQVTTVKEVRVHI